MKLIAQLVDDQYPNTGVDHLRMAARGVVLDEQGRIALTQIQADDHFGHRDYYELPGGGVHAGESLLQAVTREISEELGYQTKLIAEIGEVHDYYNLIRQENRSFYFLLQRTTAIGTHLEERESRLIKQIIWVPLSTAITLYQTMQDELVGRLVKQRELPILIAAEAIIQEKTLLIHTDAK